MLVTGGMGFIGSHFIEHVSSNKLASKIINIDKLTYASSQENISRLGSISNYKFIKGDICDSGLMSSIFEKYSVDTVVHFAAESHVDNSIVSPDEFINTNIVGTYALLDVARNKWSRNGRVGENVRFHHVSTDEVYGSIGLDQKPVNETAVYNPSSPYSSSKASSDHLVFAYYKTYGLPVTMSHCSNNYGSYQHLEKFIPVIVKACVENAPIPVYGDGSNVRDWINVADHCEAIATIIESGKVGEKYNVPGNFEISNIELANLICEILDCIRPAKKPYASLLTFVNDRLGHDWRYSIDGSKIKKECDWYPQTDFHVGIKETVQWYLSQQFNQAEAAKL